MRYQLVSFLLLSGALCGISQSVGSEGRLPCGRRKVKTVYLIQNGIDAKAGHWPWHAAIFHRANGNETYVCGGSIVDENTILTSAHCVFERHRVIAQNRVSVHVGRSQLKEEGAYTQKHDVREIIVHSGFSQDSIVHDIALIKLAGNITMTKFVQPVCLWTMDNNQDAIVDKNGTIVGFGLTERDVVSNQLKQALIRVVDALTCIESDRAVIGTHLTGDMFCGRGPSGVSACNGDSGGGMFFEVEGRWFVRGVVSFISRRENTALCDGTKPTVYTDAAKYEKWIEQYVDPRVLVRDNDVLGLNYEEKLALFDFNTCGMKALSLDENGYTRALPWLGLVGTSDTVSGNIDVQCLVTLISNWYAVGPADCFKNDGVELRVRFGGYFETLTESCIDRNGTSLCTIPTQTLQIQRLILHPKFDVLNPADNIALIELLSPVDTAQTNVAPICLPVMPELRTNEITNLSVASFLLNEQSFDSTPVRYVNAADCKKTYADKGLAVNLEGKRICGVLSEEDSMNCVALKSGTPLQQLRTLGKSERYFFRGFDIYAHSCHSPLPIVYSDGDEYLDWVLYNMRYNEEEKKSEVEDDNLEHDWQQKPENGKPWMFNLNYCGLSTSWNEAGSLNSWIGKLEAAENVTERGPITESLVVLISEWYALVPAHIVRNPVSWRSISLGYYDRIIELRCETTPGCVPPYQQVQIKNITLHPGFTEVEGEHNIALIELLEPANFTKPYIRPICLPLTERLRKAEPLSTSLAAYVTSSRSNRNVTELNTSNCQERLAQEGYFSRFKGTPRCAIDVAGNGKKSTSVQSGAPLQSLVRIGGRDRYFLSGINYFEDGYHEAYPNMPYLFTDITPYLDWILETTQRRVHTGPPKNQIPKYTRRNLLPVKNTTKRRLLNFNTCGMITPTGETPTGFNSPWLGYVESIPQFQTVFILSKCAVTLISEWQAVGPARCLSYPGKEAHIRLGGYSQTTEVKCEDRDGTTVCDPPTQKIPIDSITIHPQYNRPSYSNDIALVRLAQAADVSRANVKPICLPVFDEIRSYEPSNLMTDVFRESSRYPIETTVNEGYVNGTECQRIWDGLALNLDVDGTKMCIRQEFTSDAGCLTVWPGFALYSMHSLLGQNRSFLRGIEVLEPGECTHYYPNVYTDVDVYLDWILENLDDSKATVDVSIRFTPSGQSFDLREKLVLA